MFGKLPVECAPKNRRAMSERAVIRMYCRTSTVTSEESVAELCWPGTEVFVSFFFRSGE
jgi:hypothetical protein